MARVFKHALTVVAAFVLTGFQPQPSVYGTLQPTSGEGYISESLTLSSEATAGFFPASAETIRLGNTSYAMRASSGPVKSGSIVTLNSNGHFLSCCTSGRATNGPTVAGDKEGFRMTLYTADQVRTILAKRAADRDRSAKPRMQVDVN
jgi:hypothetical protein